MMIDLGYMALGGIVGFLIALAITKDPRSR
jgi:hypothetical protein